MTMAEVDLISRWFPIAAGSDLAYRHIYHTQLLGREFAVWRADDGYVNVWENRCLHRGVRLTIGTSDGKELKCRYHGWRYTNRSAGCTYIPAHPADAPARTICLNSFPAKEAYGLVWSGEKATGEVEPLAGFEKAAVLRPVPVNAPSHLIVEFLMNDPYLESCVAKCNADGSVTVRANDDTLVRFFVQPCDSDHSVIRGLLVNGKNDETVPISLLRHHSHSLNRLRDRIEIHAATLDKPVPMAAPIKPLPDELVNVPAVQTNGRVADLRVQVKHKEFTAEGVVSLRLEAINDEKLPTFQPGAHIDVHLQNGLVRQYSLTNGPGETDHYTIGVKREPDSRGGSSTIHDSVAEGDVLAISSPRNNFPLRRDSVQTTFIAGGIGVTPLLSMAQALKYQDLSFKFHYFVQSVEHIAFTAIIDQLGESVVVHEALSVEQTVTELGRILGEPGFARNVYICGPGPMLNAAREIASESGWSEESVHFEYFKNTTATDDSNSFVIELARSAMTLTVPAGQSILQVLRENGINISSSCEQGACGTCRCGVIAGEVLHQDVYLSKLEKAGGQTLMTCVSRAKSDRLVLDI